MNNIKNDCIINVWSNFSFGFKLDHTIKNKGEVKIHMMFYAIATNEHGETKVVGNLLSTSRIGAKLEAVEYCKKNNLDFQTLIPVKGTGRQGSILTKMTPEKRNRMFFF